MTVVSDGRAAAAQGVGPAERAAADRAASLRSAADEAEARARDEAAAGKDGTAAKPSKLQQLRARYGWLDHLVRAGTRFTEHHGTHYAAAITYFSVLSLVPLLMIAFAVAGYVLFFNPALLDEIRQAINAAVPGNLAQTINPIIDQAIAARNTVAVFGLLTALYSGVGWMGNLREALSEQWAQAPEPPALPKRLFFDLLALLGLGVALVGSFAITGAASAFATTLLDLVGLGDQIWAQVLLRVLGIALGLVANFLVFLWVIARLPRQHTPLRSAVRAAVLGAVGFEILKQVMTFYLGSVTTSPSGAVFGPLLGLLVFVNFTSQFILFVTAWAATAPGVEKPAPAAVPAPAVIRPEVVVRSGPNGATTAGLLGAGALTALLGLRAFRGRR
ncbi:MAG TPA: inner membrane protein YhjD [Pseudonocardia sp.]